MKTVGIAYNDLIPEALDLAHAIVGELNLEANSWILRAEDAEDLAQRAADTDLVITIGGDGTILRVNRAVAPRGIPLLGINMGPPRIYDRVDRDRRHGPTAPVS